MADVDAEVAGLDVVEVRIDIVRDRAGYGTRTGRLRGTARTDRHEAKFTKRRVPIRSECQGIGGS